MSCGNLGEVLCMLTSSMVEHNVSVSHNQSVWLNPKLSAIRAQFCVATSYYFHPPSLCTYAVCMCFMQVQKHRQSLTAYLTSPSPVFSSDAWKMIPVLWETETSLVDLLAVLQFPSTLKDGPNRTNQCMRAINHLVLLKSDLFCKFKMPPPPLHAGH